MNENNRIIWVNHGNLTEELGEYKSDGDKKLLGPIVDKKNSDGYWNLIQKGNIVFHYVKMYISKNDATYAGIEKSLLGVSKIESIEIEKLENNKKRSVGKLSDFVWLDKNIELIRSPLNAKYWGQISDIEKIFERFSNKDNKEVFLKFLDKNNFIERINPNKIIKELLDIDLNISEEQIYNILISLTVNNFLIFSGASGIGKTSIVEKISKKLDGDFFKLAVKSNFNDESTILGYWNPLLSKYEGTEVLKFLIQSYKNQDKIHFLLLDEMNLSKVENYFSTFLSEIDNLKEGDKSTITLFETNITNKKQYENIKYFLELYFKGDYGEFIEFGGEIDENIGFENYFYSLGFDENGNIKHEDIRNIKVFLPLSKNLKIVGTINEDETTQVLSNKVLDRSQFINFEILNLFEKSGEKVDQKLLERNYYELLEGVLKLNNLLDEGVKIFGEENFNKIKSLLNDLNLQIQQIDINESIGFRALEEILTYIKNYIGEDKKDFDIALDNQITQKVLTKLKIFSLINKDQKEAFKNIEDLIKDYKKSIKKYNHLKSNSNFNE